MAHWHIKQAFAPLAPFLEASSTLTSISVMIPFWSIQIEIEAVVSLLRKFVIALEVLVATWKSWLEGTSECTVYLAMLLSPLKSLLALFAFSRRHVFYFLTLNLLFLANYISLSLYQVFFAMPCRDQRCHLPHCSAWNCFESFDFYQFFFSFCYIDDTTMFGSEQMVMTQSINGWMHFCHYGKLLNSYIYIYYIATILQKCSVRNLMFRFGFERCSE